MSATYEIPLVAVPQTFQISLAGKAYSLTVLWNDRANCWIVDMRDLNNADILLGIPIITGVDLLEPYPHLNFGGQLLVQTDHDVDAVPTFTNLGSNGHLFFVTT